MNVEQMKQVVREILTHTDLTPCVVGHRGVGKTAGIIQVCREAALRYVPLRLGQMEVGDLVGIPYREGDIMRWSRPSWWPTEKDGPSVVHCDELNRAQQEDTLQAIFQFVEPPAEGQRRALHTHQLDPRHKVVVTINPPDGTYQVATLDRALLDRMVMIYVETDYRCWARYAEKKNFDGEVRQFLAAHNQMLARPGSALDMQMEPSERAWEMVSTLRRHCRFPQDLEMEIYAGIVGNEAATLFLQWCLENRARPLTAEEVLDAWEEVAPRARGQRDDLQAATLNLLITHLQNHPRLSAIQEQNLVNYIDVLPRDLRFGLVKSLLKIPAVAAVLSKDQHDAVIFDAIEQISREAS
ncbi:hypothetical protein [Geoalkalibacter halelectricus]|uniref:ATPase dynein-related AAA domain-containing protein n=1 Tax=Geoalkalibacter halelectricus TaxID=2847045 RepID=A0ABY5ZPP5_9BACT|nr:hypothetical protein [Geoalkalibacter halelectricus]MDO3378840.1 hypothetical protein [Geoalkalibacter halelectricus]UWZ79855.1 hypothetical protein L9S41_00305 [Geoalkalibacter halelectricus]